MKMRTVPFCTVMLLIVITTGCSTYRTNVMDAPGRATVYEDTGSPGALAGVGVESQDIVSMTDKMMRDILANPAIAGRGVPPRVIIDDNNFYNESSSIINKKMITERLMVNLNRAAAGRLVFIERQAASMVELERTLKREGVVSQGTLGSTRMTAGADYSLTGRIMSQSSVSNSSGMASRYHQISFKLVELETGIAAWTGLYEFKKTAQDDILYR